MNDRTQAAHVVMLCGIAGAGKTTFALALQAHGYTRLSIDQDVWRRHGRYGIDYAPSLYQEYSTDAERALRRRLIRLLREGHDCVLDFSFWSRARRRSYRALIERLGSKVTLIYLRATREVLRHRLDVRSTRFDADAAFPIDDVLLDRYLATFEPPDGEGERVIEQHLDTRGADHRNDTHQTRPDQPPRP